MMPMLRVFSSGYCVSTVLSLPCPGAASVYTEAKRGVEVSAPLRLFRTLPAIMRERLVGLRHLVSVLSLLHRRPAVVRRVQQLTGELLGHALLRPPPRGPDQPPHRQRHPALRPHLDRYLIGGAADPAGFDLDRRLAVVHRRLEPVSYTHLTLPTSDLSVDLGG